MSQVSLRKLDLNLLTVFEAVYEERSQQKASERLFMSQPAISNAISRLRHLVDDRLFFGSRTIQATAKADELYLQVHQALDLIRVEFFAKQGFDPKETHRTFNISIAYGSGYLLGAAIFKRLAERAPQARLVIHNGSPADEVPRLLREQKLDVAMMKPGHGDTMLESELCLDFKVAIVARKDHPRITGNPTPEQLFEEQYVWVHDSTHSSDVPEFQDFIRRAEERTMLEVPSVLMIPVMVSQTDLIALLPWSYAQKMMACYPIEAFELPFRQLDNRSLLVWHRAFESDPGLVWFRSLCSEVAEDFRNQIASVKS
jgi:LysR family transcriptional regulator, transcriptional activator for leuABCD operon